MLSTQISQQKDMKHELKLLKKQEKLTALSRLNLYSDNLTSISKRNKKSHVGRFSKFIQKLNRDLEAPIFSVYTENRSLEILI